MKIFFDTNILLDWHMQRTWFVLAGQVIEMAAAPENEAYIALHTLSNAFYVLYHHGYRDSATQIIQDTIENFEIISLQKDELWACFWRGIFDFEDALQIVSAESINADVIITRDAGFIGKTQVPVMTPEEFVEKYFCE